MALELTTGVLLQLQDQHDNIYRTCYPRTEGVWVYRDEDLADGSYIIMEASTAVTSVQRVSIIKLGATYTLRAQMSLAVISFVQADLDFPYRKWIHIAWTVEQNASTVVTIYQDGIALASGTFSFASDRGAIVKAELGNNQFSTLPAKMWFSEYVIFNAVKTPFQIYRLAHGCNPDQLGAHWMWFLNADNETNVVDTLAGTWKDDGGGSMIAKPEFQPFAIERDSDAIRLAEIEDPLTITYDAVWFLLERTAAFRAIIPTVNRIKYTRGKRDPDRDKYADADLPEVRILPDLGTPDMHPATNLAKVTQGYRIEINVGDDRIDEHLLPLLWVILRCVFGWKDVTLTGASFIKLMDVVGITPTEDGHLEETGIEGWQGVCVVSTELWFNGAYMAVS